MQYLQDQGLRIVSSNARFPEGELDLVARDGTQRVAVEIRTRVTDSDPIDAIPESKRQHVAAIARRYGADRIDLIALGLTDTHLDVHWVPDAL